MKTWISISLFIEPGSNEEIAFVESIAISNWKKIASAPSEIPVLTVLPRKKKRTGVFPDVEQTLRFRARTIFTTTRAAGS